MKPKMKQGGSLLHSYCRSIKEDANVNLTNITVNTQSSIRIEGSKILYFDPHLIQDASHGADFKKMLGSLDEAIQVELK